MVKKSAGYREIEHTADWELEVWAPNLPALLEQAARGMYKLAGAQLDKSTFHERSLELAAEDPEDLLVSFLSELLYFGESEGLGFDGYQLSLEGGNLRANLQAARLESVEKEIKAVTYHNMKVEESNRGLEVRIVFDV